MGTDIVLFGGVLLDRYFHIDRWPHRGQDGFFQQEESFVGGCAINMAVTIKNLGGTAHVLSCVGDDPTGREILHYLDRHSLSKRLVCPLHGDTGCCLVFLEEGGERTFLTRAGVETRVSPGLTGQILSLAPAWAGVTGYYLLGEDAERILECLEKLHEDGTRFLFDPSPLVGKIRGDHLARMVAISTILTPNTAELPFLGGEEALPALTAQGKAVILKRGADGGTVYAPLQCFDYAGVPCRAADTTGAGDSFSGALLHAMNQGLSLRQGVELAARCAAKTCGVCGPHGFWKLEENHNA